MFLWVAGCLFTAAPFIAALFTNAHITLAFSPSTINHQRLLRRIRDQDPRAPGFS
jgi:hypothetical protein